MVEYIEREALKNDIAKSTEPFNTGSVFRAINRQPAADVAPVVHGQWISKNTIGYDWTFVCSNCGYIDGYPFNDRHNFCPNCGAKMDGGDGDE